jgi:hypothetical protein
MALVTKTGQTLSSTGGTSVTFDYQSQTNNVREFEVSSDALLAKRKFKSRVVTPKIVNGRPGGFSKAVNEYTFVSPFTCADGSRDETYIKFSVSRNVEVSDAELDANINEAIEQLALPTGVIRVAIKDNTQLA